MGNRELLVQVLAQIDFRDLKDFIRDAGRVPEGAKDDNLEQLANLLLDGSADFERIVMSPRLQSFDLEVMCESAALATEGRKPERIQRLIRWFNVEFNAQAGGARSSAVGDASGAAGSSAVSDASDDDRKQPPASVESAQIDSKCETDATVVDDEVEDRPDQAQALDRFEEAFNQYKKVVRSLANRTPRRAWRGSVSGSIEGAELAEHASARAGTTTAAWFSELEKRANALEGLSTTSSSKYDEFKEWIRAELDVAPGVCFLSELSKQWTPRVGQALMGFPKVLVLLVRADSASETSERLSALHRYATGLHATIVLVGDDGAWKLGLVTGTPGRALYESLLSASPYASTEERDEAHERGRPSSAALDFMDLETLEQGELIWECLIGEGPIEFDEAIRSVANTLRDDGRLEFERLRRDGPIYAAIEDAISWCARRGVLFDRPRRGCVRAVILDATDFAREHWRDCVMSAVGESDEWTDRDELVRASANCAVETYGLDMQRLRSGGTADTAIRSAINGLIRVGHLERQGGQLLRKTRGHPPIRNDEAPTSDSAPTSSSQPEQPLAVHEAPSGPTLRALVGDIPGESEAAFMQLLGTPLKATTELHAAVEKHVKEFEDAFEVHQFLDMTGAEKLAAESRQLIQLWPTLSTPEKHLAQAAILYFVDSEDADDDFRIGGLRTDKLVMEAVIRVVRRAPATL